MVGTIFAASVGGACALAIISGAIGLYLFDRYLKKKEVKDHDKEGKFKKLSKDAYQKIGLTTIWIKMTGFRCASLHNILKLWKVAANDTYTTNPLSISGVETYNADQSNATENDTLLRQASISHQPYQANSVPPNPVPRQRNAGTVDSYGSRQPDGTIMADQTLGAEPNTTLSRSFNYNH